MRLFGGLKSKNARLGRQARAFVRERYDWSASAQRLVEMLERDDGPA